MPFPPNLEAMHAVGYEYVRAETCRECGLEVEVYLTPGKREIQMEPMCGNHSLAIRHLEVCTPSGRCNIAPKQEPPSAPRSGPWHAVTDPNGQLLGVKYDPVDGIFRCRWRKGEGFHTGVPEEIFLTIQRVPFAYSYYQRRVKGQFPYTKVE